MLAFMTDELSFKFLCYNEPIPNKEVVIMNNIIDLTKPVAEVVKNILRLKLFWLI